jgi:hypothetical protein
MTKSWKVVEIRYPILGIFFFYIIILGTFCIIWYLKPIGGEIYAVIAYHFVFYFYAQYRYKNLTIYSDRLNINFMVSFYLKDKTHYFSDIEFVFFKYHVSRADPFLTIKFKNGKKKTYLFPKPQLTLIQQYLDDEGIRIEKSTSGWDRISDFS